MSQRGGKKWNPIFWQSVLLLIFPDGLNHHPERNRSWTCNLTTTRWWFQIFFNFHHYLGKWSKLTSIFFNGVGQPPTRLCHDQNVGPHVWSMDSVTSGNQVQFLFHIGEKNRENNAPNSKPFQQKNRGKCCSYYQISSVFLFQVEKNITSHEWPILHPRKFNIKTWKWWIGRWCSFSMGVFSGSSRSSSGV